MKRRGSFREERRQPVALSRDKPALLPSAGCTWSSCNPASFATPVMFISSRGTSGPTLCGRSPGKVVKNMAMEREVDGRRHASCRSNAAGKGLTERFHRQRRAHDDDAIGLSHILRRQFKKMLRQRLSVHVAPCYASDQKRRRTAAASCST